MRHRPLVIRLDEARSTGEVRVAPCRHIAIVAVSTYRVALERSAGNWDEGQRREVSLFPRLLSVAHWLEYASPDWPNQQSVANINPPIMEAVLPRFSEICISMIGVWAGFRPVHFSCQRDNTQIKAPEIKAPHRPVGDQHRVRGLRRVASA